MMIGEIEYASGIKGDIYLPESSAPATGHPAVLLIHGGGWNSMDRSAMDGLAKQLCAGGSAVFNIDYRLAPEFCWPCGIDDCKTALKFLFEEGVGKFNLDPRKIFVMGGSAGGHYALITGLSAAADQVAGIISFSGIDDVYPDFAGTPERYRTLLGKDEITGDDLKMIDPIEFYHDNAPPILCTHFVRDTVVPVESCLDFVHAVRKRGGRINMYMYDFGRDGAGHAIWLPETQPRELFPDITANILFFIRFICGQR